MNQRVRDGSRLPCAVMAVVVGLLTLCLVSVCGLALLGSGNRSVRTQGGGLPTLRHLDWGFPYYEQATWSPDGRWLALLAGPDPAGSHLEVLSSDGREHHNLTAWGCGDALTFSIAWRADNALSCLTRQGQLIQDTPPFRTPRTIALTARLVPPAGGGAYKWFPDGTALVSASIIRPTDPAPPPVGNAQFYVVNAQGVVALQPLATPTDEVSHPAWVPHRAQLSYIQSVMEPSGLEHANLLVSEVTFGGSQGLTLGPPRLLASDVDGFGSYAWSPSGRWVAVRHGDYRGGDKIYLVNAQDPTQTLDVVLAHLVGQQMMSPIWSPDGQTLIVFSVGYNAAQPYQIDIGAYVQSKGLTP